MRACVAALEPGTPRGVDLVLRQLLLAGHRRPCRLCRRERGGPGDARRVDGPDVFQELSAVALALLAFTLPQMAEASGCIAVFCGGLTIGNDHRASCAGVRFRGGGRPAPRAGHVHDHRWHARGADPGVEQPGLPHAEIFAIMIGTVILSMFAHGLTSLPGATWYARHAAGLGRAGAPELQAVTDLPVRIPHRAVADA